MCLITFIIAFTVYLQNLLKSNKTYFKDNKCNPFLAPFAGILEETDDPLHSMKNMESCMNELNFDVGNSFLDILLLIKADLFKGLLHTIYSEAVSSIPFLSLVCEFRYCRHLLFSCSVDKGAFLLNQLKHFESIVLDISCFPIL